MPNISEDGLRRIAEARIRGNETRGKLHLERYNKNPKLCLQCGKKLEYLKRDNDFCNHSHAALYNNSHRKIGEYNNHCKNCNKVFNFKGKVFRKDFCNLKCLSDYNQKLWIIKWLSGEDDGTSGRTATSKRIKRYFIEKHGNKCMRCGQGEVNPHTNNVPIELHHKDGKHTNNKEENLELLCPNCHSLTGTYKAGNKNSTRTERKIIAGLV